jgi:serine/threonine protein phosphatase PrpC
MCTDGIHGKLDSASLTTVLVDAQTAADSAAQIVHEAITRGSTDNATALVINVT